MSQVCTVVDQLVPLLGEHRRRRCLLSNPVGVTGLSALALPSSPRIRCSATIGSSLQRPHATIVDKPWQAQQAAVLAIGTANTANCVPQDEYADWYFRVTRSDHLTGLKAKMKKICYNSTIKKRYFHHTEDIFLEHPELVDLALPSLDARQAILSSAVPELAAAAAARAIAEWGRPASDVTHLVFATYSGAHMPGADLRLASLLGLRRAAQRTMMYLGGCAAGSAALRVAKDVAENNRGARVLDLVADTSYLQRSMTSGIRAGCRLGLLLRRPAVSRLFVSPAAVPHALSCSSLYEPRATCQGPSPSDQSVPSTHASCLKFVPSTNWFHSSARPPSSPGCLGLAVASQNPLLGDYWTEHSTSCVLHWQAKRSAVLAIGTANPANCVQYVDWYFRVTKSDHLTGFRPR
ncbi:hypothetical protein EJB05_57067, partial [Eragrostis curvula]